MPSETKARWYARFREIESQVTGHAAAGTPARLPPEAYRAALHLAPEDRAHVPEEVVAARLRVENRGPVDWHTQGGPAKAGWIYVEAAWYAAGSNEPLRWRNSATLPEIVRGRQGNLAEERLLVLEVQVEGAGRDSGGTGDRVGRDRVKPATREELGAARDQAAAGLRPASRGSGIGSRTDIHVSI